MLGIVDNLASIIHDEIPKMVNPDHQLPFFVKQARIRGLDANAAADAGVASRTKTPPKDPKDDETVIPEDCCKNFEEFRDRYKYGKPDDYTG